MLPTDTEGRLLIAAERQRLLQASAAGRAGGIPLRRRLGRWLQALGARLAGDELLPAPLRPRPASGRADGACGWRG